MDGDLNRCFVYAHSDSHYCSKFHKKELGLLLTNCCWNARISGNPFKGEPGFMKALNAFVKCFEFSQGSVKI